MKVKRTLLPRQFKELKLQAVYDREHAIMALTEAVAAAMEDKRLTRAEVARRLGVTKSAVTQLLKGPNFRFGTAAELALAVGLRFQVACCVDDTTKESRRVQDG